MTLVATIARFNCRRLAVSVLLALADPRPEARADVPRVRRVLHERQPGRRSTEVRRAHRLSGRRQALAARALESGAHDHAAALRLQRRDVNRAARGPDRESPGLLGATPLFDDHAAVARRSVRLIPQDGTRLSSRTCTGGSSGTKPENAGRPAAPPTDANASVDCILMRGCYFLERENDDRPSAVAAPCCQAPRGRAPDDAE